MKKLFIISLVLIALALVACDDAAAPSPSITPSVIGGDNLQFSWIGDFAAAPYACTEDVKYDAYRNTTDGAGYFCDGIDWRLIAQDGTDGTDGVSIVWLGSFDTAPSSPELNQAYFNNTDGNSYIYNGTAWVILVQGKYAKIIDTNSVYLGYLLNDAYVMSSKGYVYSYATYTSGTAVKSDVNNGNFLFFESTNCTGTPHAIVTTYFTILYSLYADKFYKYNGAVVKNNIVFQSRVDAKNNSCVPIGTFEYNQAYEYEEISRTDAGIPSTITPPYSVVFQ